VTRLANWYLRQRVLGYSICAAAITLTLLGLLSH